MNGAARTLERRRQKRSSVLKRAQIAAGSTLYDCCIMDSSEDGVRIEMPTPVALPPRVVLRLADGISIPASPRWSRGADTGLEFTGADLARGNATAARIWALHEMLADGRTDEALQQLRAVAYFGDAALREAAEGAEASRATVAGALRACAIAAS